MFESHSDLGRSYAIAWVRWLVGDFEHIYCLFWGPRTLKIQFEFVKLHSCWVTPSYHKIYKNNKSAQNRDFKRLKQQQQFLKTTTTTAIFEDNNKLQQTPDLVLGRHQIFQASPCHQAVSRSRWLWPLEPARRRRRGGHSSLLFFVVCWNGF